MAETDKILFTHPHVEAFPVGSVFFTAINNNPSELLGYGTWELIGKGRTILGASDTDEGEETGGSMSKTLAAANIPGHTHSIPSHTHSVSAHTHQIPAHNHTASSASGGSHAHSITINNGGSHNHSITYNNGNNKFIGGGPASGGATTKSQVRSTNEVANMIYVWPKNFSINSGGTHNHSASAASAGSHSHTITVANKAAFNTNSGGGGTSGSGGSGNTGSTGSGTSFDITPSYIKLFIWKRIE